jgi:protein SCO1/2
MYTTSNIHKDLVARRVRRLFLSISFCFIATVCGYAQPGPPGPSSPLYGARPETGNVSTGLPTALRDVRIDQKLDQQLPLDLTFRDESGKEVKLGQYFGQRPVVLALVFYDCPRLCNQMLNGMVTSFRVIPFQMGKEYDVVTISFDPRETAQMAQAKKNVYVDYLPEKMRADAPLVGISLPVDPENIKQITDAVGFRYHYDEATQQFAHASGIMIATPHGKLSRYFYGIDYPARDLRLGLIESSANKIGSPADQLLLYCYHYDPGHREIRCCNYECRPCRWRNYSAWYLAMFVFLRRRNPAKLEFKTGGAGN